MIQLLDFCKLELDLFIGLIKFLLRHLQVYVELFDLSYLLLQQLLFLFLVEFNCVELLFKARFLFNQPYHTVPLLFKLLLTA